MASTLATPAVGTLLERARDVWTDPHSASMALFAVIVGTYWTLSLVLLAVDLTRGCRGAKFQPDKGPDAASLRDVVGNVVLQQVLLIFPVFYFGGGVLLPLFSLSPELPSAGRVVFDLVCFVVGAEVWFYYTHRLFHHRLLYGPFHKWHHKYKAPFGFCALYFHPLEMLIQGGTLFFGPMLVGTHITVVLAIALVGMAAIVSHHSGYEVPGDRLPKLDGSMAQFHDWHHVATTKNFGVVGFLDWFHGTDVGYHEYVEAWEAQRRKAAKGRAAA